MVDTNNPNLQPVLDDAPPKVDVPIDATGSDVAVLIRNAILQLVGIVGILIAAFGLSDALWIVKVYRVMSASEALPLIGLIAAFGASGYQIFRAIKRNRSLQTLSFFVPQRVAKSPANPSAAVTAAVEAATVVIEQGAAPSPPVTTKGL